VAKRENLLIIGATRRAIPSGLARAIDLGISYPKIREKKVIMTTAIPIAMASL
jgi:hypothetical protein